MNHSMPGAQQKVASRLLQFFGSEPETFEVGQVIPIAHLREGRREGKYQQSQPRGSRDDPRTMHALAARGKGLLAPVPPARLDERFATFSNQCVVPGPVRRSRFVLHAARMEFAAPTELFHVDRHGALRERIGLNHCPCIPS